MEKEQKVGLIRIIITAVLMVVLHFIPAEGITKFILYMIPYILISYDIFAEAWEGIENREPLDENLLMVIATVGAIILGLTSTGDFGEAIAVMLFYKVGEWFEDYAVDKSRDDITALMDIRPDYANIMQGGTLVKVDPNTVETGSEIIVQPGEKVPIDGTIVSGNASLDCAALTGESIPVDVEPGMEVVSGSICQNGVLTIQTTKKFGESTVSKILDLMENASSKKAKSEDFISRFARVYTPAVVGCAVLLAFIPPLVRMACSLSPGWGDWVYRALTFLVISCPCALVISIPLTFFAGLGGASRQGVLIKGSNYLEALSDADCMVFDKTGTLTKGVFQVTGIYPSGITTDRLLEMAAQAECASSHPISRSLQSAYLDRFGKAPDRERTTDIREISGHGVVTKVDGHVVAAGNEKLMRSEGITAGTSSQIGTIVHVAIDGKYAGCIVISDVPRETSAEALRELKAAGVKKTVMLTGDSKVVAGAVAGELGVDEVYAELLPGDKVAKVEELIEQAGKNKTGKVAFTGDGINDAPVLSRADVGIAMGAMGSDAAIEAADVVLMDDNPLGIVKAVKVSRKCMRIVKENITFAIAVKFICLVLGALGIADMWVAVFADVGVMVIAVLNALRAMKY